VNSAFGLLFFQPEKGEYTRHGFWESVQDVLRERHLCDPQKPLGEVAQQFPE
jgi:hypothetical protein